MSQRRTGDRLAKTHPVTSTLVLERSDEEEEEEGGEGSATPAGKDEDGLSPRANGTKRGHRRRATTGVTPDRGGGLEEEEGGGEGDGEEVGRTEMKLSPASETRKARRMLDKLFRTVVKACKKRNQGSSVKKYVEETFLSRRFPGDEKKKTLT